MNGDPRADGERRRADGGRHGPWMHDDWSRGEGPGRRPGGSHGPQRRMRRMGCVFAVFFILVLVGAASVVGLIASALGILQPGPGGGGGGPFAQGFVILLILFIAFGLWRLGRGLRGLAAPIDDLVGAARRIENGDLTARVSRPTRSLGDLRVLIAAFNTMAERLEVDERQRRTLLADVSHELRTPLAVVRGSLEAIQDGVHPGDHEHVQAIIDETDVLARLIDDLRTVSLAEAGTLALYPEATDLGLLATDVAASHAAAAHAGGVELTVETGGVPLLDVDPVRMREVVGNLLANSLRYTPDGGTIGITVSTDPAGGVTLTVRDTGAGIEPEVLPHVFERFWKSPSSRGSGLGLAIVRNLVERHGGTVSAASTPGVVTAVTVHLPAPRVG